jgi:transcriptional antiterminator NusG
VIFLKQQANTAPANDSSSGSLAAIDFANWYVLSTTSGKETKIEREIGNLTNNQYTLFVPRRELFHSFKGIHRKVIRPLFPGYIFVYKEILAILKILRNSPLDGRLHPLLFGHALAMVRETEMELLMKITGPTGLVKTSQAILCKDRTVVINSGPLKDLPGSILYINKRKRKAVLQVELLNQCMRVAVGVEVLNPACVSGPIQTIKQHNPS